MQAYLVQVIYLKKINIIGYFINGIEKNKINFNNEGIIKNNIIKYNIDNDEFILTINKDRFIFNKRNKDSTLKYVFTIKSNNESFYKINENNLKIYINLLTKSIKIKDNTIDINFMLENCKSILHIEYEVIE